MPLRIYLGDLTYDTVSLSTGVFPLNVGFVASYSIAQFGDAVEFTLFKYIEEIDQAIQDSPPDVLGLSNYCWNKNVGLEMFRMLADRNPHALRVFGGPNFPQDRPSQQVFFLKHRPVDVYVPIEGEIGFANIIERALSAASPEQLREATLSSAIAGCISRGMGGEVLFGEQVGLRLRELDHIPSPYLSGLMDKFFDGRLIPMLQTNRGCPFTCTFCVDGADSVKKVTRFSQDRVFEELDYIAEHVPKNMHSMEISDLNFGMYAQDLKICEYIAELQRTHDYPRFIIATTGKNAKERIIAAVRSLKGSLRLSMSVQSMNPEVLTNIRRDNIKVDRMIQLAPTIKASGLRTTSEVILCLPGETYESQLKTMRELLAAGLEHLQVYTCMILDGSELGTPQQRERWSLQTKFRVLPRDFAKLSNGKNVIEIEESVVSTDTLSFDEYVQLRLLAFSIFVGNMGIVYDPLLKYLRERGVDVFDLFTQMVDQLPSASAAVQDIFERFRRATIDEIWNSPADIEAHFQDDAEYEKLLRGEVGMNVMTFHHTIVMAEHMAEWTEHMTTVAEQLLKEKASWTSEVADEFAMVAGYCHGLCHNTLGRDRMSTNPELRLRYDVQQWMLDSSGKSLAHFRLPAARLGVFRLTPEQFQHVENLLDRHGNTTFGRSQILNNTPVQMLWRQCEFS